MVPSQNNLTRRLTRRLAIARGMLVAGLVWTSTAAGLWAQSPPIHYEHAGILAPGAIGSGQLRRGGPLAGYYQPVEIRAPQGALISLAVDQQFDPPQAAPARAGMLVGNVYRLKVGGISQAEGLEVFPSIEIINRTYPPPGQELKFPIPIDLTETDLKLALKGHFITRVVYVEDPKNALPIREGREQQWFEVESHEDPLAVADRLGRPVAIVRLGGRLPDFSKGVDPAFFFGGPPLLRLGKPAELPAPLPQEKEARRTGMTTIATPALPRTQETIRR